MNIIIATGIFPPDIGGPATYVPLLAQELSKKGHTIMVVTYADTAGVVVGDGYRVEKVSRNIPKGWRHLWYFWKIVRNSRGVDSIYAQDPVSAGVPAVLASMICRKKFF